MNFKDFKYKGHRNSYTDLNEIYFWTITINKWQHLLKPADNKMIVINSLQLLVKQTGAHIRIRYNAVPYSPFMRAVKNDW
jgi:hypothetical protein